MEYDPDIKATKGGDPDIAQLYKDSDRGLAKQERRRPVVPKRLLAAFNEHQGHLLALQKLNFVKGITDENSVMGALPIEDFIYDQIKIVNFIYSNILTRFYQQQKDEATRIPLSISDKRERGSESDDEDEKESKKAAMGKSKKSKKSKKAKKTKGKNK
jgi:hypothetical protein